MSDLPVTAIPQPVGLGLRAAARELRISHPALLKAFTSGRVERLPDGTYDVEDCRRRMAANTNPVKSRAARAQQNSNSQPVASPTDIHRAPLADDFRPDLLAGVPAFESSNVLPAKDSTAEASRIYEWTRAEHAQLKLQREKGTLVELAPINAFVAGMIVKARDALCRMPGELCDALAHETDALKIESLLSARINEALASLSEYKRAA